MLKRTSDAGTKLVSRKQGLKRIEPNHILALDGVRGLAILLVLSAHLMGGPISHNVILRFNNSISRIGWVGVDLFFALSGFLITGILFDTLDTPNFFRTFYMRRVLRIFPLYYAYLAVLFLFRHPLHINWHGTEWILLTYTQNVLLPWDSSRFSVLVGHLWSLSVEEQFYLIWPLFVFSIKNKNRLMRLAIILIVGAAVSRGIVFHHGIAWQTIYKSPIFHTEPLLIGGWLALALRGNYAAAVHRAARPVFFLSFTILLLYAWNHGNDLPLSSNFVNLPGYSLIALACGSLLLLSLDPTSILHVFFKQGLLRWLGKYSYGIYVLHRVVYMAIDDLVMRTHPLFVFLHPRHLAHLFVLSLALCAILVIAWLSYNFYEARFLRLKKYFGYSKRRPREQFASR